MRVSRYVIGFGAIIVGFSLDVVLNYKFDKTYTDDEAFMVFLHDGFTVKPFINTFMCLLPVGFIIAGLGIILVTFLGRK